MQLVNMAAYGSRGAFHDDSDADDEYERSVITSPTLPAEFDASPTDSESLSTEHTPTFSNSARDGSSPHGVILDWTAEQCADFISSLGLPQYSDRFIEESIAGDALVALLHSDLKEMGISSIGHRLTILKGVYDVKIKQNVNVEPEHYVPLSAESETPETGPTQDDIARIIHIIKDRDAEIRSLREGMNRLSEENRKLREDILPLIKQAKDRSQPLPTPEDRDFPSLQSQDTSSKSGLSRKISKRLHLKDSNHLAATKNHSPTNIHEGKPLTDSSSLDPSAAAMAASTHLTSSIRDNSSPNAPQPSPTSPAYTAQAPNSGGPPQRGFSRVDPDISRDTGASWNTAYTSPPDRREPLSGGTTPSLSSVQSTVISQPPPANPQVEIFKSFRVSIDDPCHKVLPVALKKYNITADWKQYALYIVHGDQERCLGLNEKPLILFKQLDREGRKPMFMLRKHATPTEGHTIGGVGSGGFSGGGMNGPGTMPDQLPGGVL